MRQTLLADCAARSRPLDALLDSTEEDPLLPDEAPADLFGDWREVFESDDAFRDRLDLAGLTPESARERFDSAAETDPEQIPPTLETAAGVVDRAVEEDDSEAVRSLVARHGESPFVHLLAPLAAAIAEEVALDIDYAPTARESLEDWLVERLTKGFRHPLFILFKAHQHDEYPETDFADAADSTAVYDEFVAEIRDADYEPVFEYYPVLLELLGRVADQWRGAVRRLDDRLAADRTDLAETFNAGENLGRVTDVETLSDDPHGDGELVLGVHFEADCSVVYKPRSVAGEEAFGDLLGWVNDRTDVPDLTAPSVLDRKAYGWMEFVAHRECDSASGVGRFYERMGAVSALAFVLGSTDFHYENVVAAGDQPVIVDQETALAPGFDSTDAPAGSAVSSLLEDSIFDTLLLPVTKQSEEGGELATSGLSELSGEEQTQKLPNFRHPNTDAMDLGFDKVCRFDGQNLPRFDGETHDAADYLDRLKRGFREVTTAIVANRDELLDSAGPLAAFEESPVRYLVRPTGHYAAKLNEAQYSSALRSGFRQSLLFEELYQIFLPRDEGGETGTDDGTGENGDGGDLWRLVATEKETLRRFVIPRFTVAAGGRELRDGRGNRLGVFADESPLDRARRRIADLDDHWIETQLRLVDLTFTDSKVSDPVAAPTDERPNAVPGADSPEEVVSNVVALLEDETRERDGALRWAEAARSSPTDHLHVREPDADLYEGYAGVGLFLAAVAAVRDDADLADRSRRVLNAALESFDADTADGTDSSIGGMTGTGSVAYGLAAAGDLLDDPDLLERARTVAGRTTREEVAADADLDVIGGAAGELLGQLAVYERTGDDAALDRARWCGDRLLDATTEVESGYRVPTGEAPRRFGFAHGVGGIGFALVKLAGLLDDPTPEYGRVGRDALEYDAERWRRERDAEDKPDPDAPENIWGWCNGLAGVGASRVAAADFASGERVGDFSLLREEVRAEPSAEDSLCCGSTGRALFALDAGEVFGDSSLTERGADLFAAMLDRADSEGRLRLANHLPMLPKFGLFTGLTGVGYVALRLEAEERGAEIDLPNVTRLE